ncbi:MAG: hypothetical protein ACOX7F_06670 [Eubacteriales bacterium]|jgi:hypothetical protein
MEAYFYRCPKCGFLQMVPAYWVDYDPKPVYEMEHLDMQTGEPCPVKELLLQPPVEE